MPKPSLAIEKLQVKLNDILFINEISLTFEPGKLYAIIGPNGSGKTTLLKAIAGISKSSSGKVLWQGRDLLQQTRAEISRTISLVPQNPVLQFNFPLIEFVSMGRYPYKYTSNSHASNLEWALKSANVWEFRDRSIMELSSGERQRAFIARSLATNSPILMLDEPTASLDPYQQFTIWNLLSALAKQGKTVIVTTHDLPSVQNYCDQVVVLHHGQCVAAGPYNTIMTPELSLKVFRL